MKHQLMPPFAGAFDVPPEVESWAAKGIETRRRGYGEWQWHPAPEESALPPILAWGHEERIALINAYNAAWGEGLEPDEYYDVAWPPRALLCTAGRALEALCPEHGDEREGGCGYCDSPESAQDHVEAAVWHWYVYLQTWKETVPGSWGLEDSESVHVMTTEVDPRHVEYGADAVALIH